MKQNKYDDPGFFANYSQMARSIGGLDAAGEWPAFRALLPQLREKKVLDLGCGFGWHCRYARESPDVSLDRSGQEGEIDLPKWSELPHCALPQPQVY